MFRGGVSVRTSPRAPPVRTMYPRPRSARATRSARAAPPSSSTPTMSPRPRTATTPLPAVLIAERVDPALARPRAHAGRGARWRCRRASRSPRRTRGASRSASPCESPSRRARPRPRRRARAPRTPRSRCRRRAPCRGRPGRAPRPPPPSASIAPERPRPVQISSATRSAPAASHASRSIARKPAGGTTQPPRPRIGSTSTHPMPPRSSARAELHAARLDLRVVRRVREELDARRELRRRRGRESLR